MAMVPYAYTNIPQSVRDNDFFIRSAVTVPKLIEVIQDTTITNVACGCRSGHRLHHAETTIVRYLNNLWALSCAVDNLLLQIETHRKDNMELAGHRVQLQELCRTNSNRIGHLENKRAQWVDKFLLYSYHLDDCDVITKAMTGRTDLKSKCSCGRDDILKAIEDHGYSVDPERKCL